MRATLRIVLVIPFAFVAACLAAGGFIVMVTVGAGTDTVAGAAGATPGELVVLALSAAAIVGAFSFVPALVAILLAEVFAWRSVFFYLLAGCAIGLGAVALLVPPERAISDADARFFLSAGAIAGAVYWLIAGRSAGFRRADPQG